MAGGATLRTLKMVGPPPFSKFSKFRPGTLAGGATLKTLKLVVPPLKVVCVPLEENRLGGGGMRGCLHGSPQAGPPLKVVCVPLEENRLGAVGSHQAAQGGRLAAQGGSTRGVVKHFSMFQHFVGILLQPTGSDKGVWGLPLGSPLAQAKDTVRNDRLSQLRLQEAWLC